MGLVKSAFFCCFGVMCLMLTWGQLIGVTLAIIGYFCLRPWILVLYYRVQGVPFAPFNPLDVDPSWMIKDEKYLAPVYPKYFSGVVGVFHFLNIIDPELVREILVTKEGNFKKDHPFLPLLRPIFGNGLLLAEDKIWKPERRVANKAFNNESLSKMAGLIEQACNQKLDQWKSKQQKEKTGNIQVLFDKEMLDLTLGIIGECAFGNDYSSVNIEGENARVTDYIKRMESQAFDYGATASYFIFPQKFEYSLDQGARDLKNLRDKVKTLGHKILANRIQEIQKDPASLSNKTDLLNLMIQSHLEGKNLHDCQDLVDVELLIDECVTFVFAGSETTAILLQWIFYNLTQHPEVATKLREELETHFAEALKIDPSKIISNYRELDRLPYLDSVIQETLRLFPPAPIISPRIAVKDTIVKGLKIKKGTLIEISPYLIHRSPFNWSNPTTFNPDRKDSDSNLLAFLPFSEGKRGCIGKFFALMEAKIAITKFVLDQEIRCDLSSVERLKTKITLFVEGGMEAQISTR
eukprot:CAMPEP_0114972430 /NCGR_PEP_ID=MMETSP0216-20121206/388_1 /TAXON_ID=223996 /ORGANISM="Protocruzia adherens, Strain Boccale" /LENGTH=521 /DNA_ID=CAMNT_0002332797 /DNA_START=48 /DNA_END=1613 /DNA_ORIENTATION=+